MKLLLNWNIYLGLLNGLIDGCPGEACLMTSKAMLRSQRHMQGVPQEECLYQVEIQEI